MAGVSTLALALVFLFFYGAHAQNNIGCQVPGECKGSTFIDINVYEDINDCLNHCKETIGCQYWTYYKQDQACLTFVGCPDLTFEKCTECFSGDVECEALTCNARGVCKGELNKFYQAPSLQHCANSCVDDPECTWYTYDVAGGRKFCTILRNCPFLDENCNTCISAQNGCWVTSFPDIPDHLDYSKLLTIGGNPADDGQNTASNTVEVNDLSHHALTCSAPGAFPNKNVEGMGFVLNGTAIVCGGSRVQGGPPTDECYEFQNNAWSLFSSSLTVPRANGATLWQQDYALVAGGVGASGQLLDSVDIFNPDGSVGAGTPMPEPLQGHCIARISAKFMLLSGGYDMTGTASRKSYSFDSDSGIWAELDEMTFARADHICHEIETTERGTEIVVASGAGTSTSTEIFSTVTMSWSAGPILPVNVLGADTVPNNGTFLMVGGSVVGNLNYGDVYSFQPESLQWEKRDFELSTSRSDLAAIITDTADVVCP